MAAERHLSTYYVETDLKDIAELIERLKKAANELHIFAQVFDPSVIVSDRHLFHAYALAQNAFKEGENYAKSIEAEVIVKAAAETRIDEAIMKVGAKNTAGFILLTDAGDNELAKLLEILHGKAKKCAYHSNLDVEKVKATFNLTDKMLENYSLEDLVLEKMALSGHEN